MTWKSVISKYEFILAVFSFILLFVSLYQLEIVYINIKQGSSCFYLPFYLFGCINVDVARDIWYTVIIIAFFLLLYAIWKWE